MIVCLILPGVWVLVLLCWILSCWHREKQSCSNKWLRSLISLFHFHSHRPKRDKKKKKTSCIFIHKIIYNVNIGFCCWYNQFQFTYCSPEWVEKYERSFPSFPTLRLLCLLMENEFSEFLCTPSIVSRESLSTALRGAFPSVCIELQLCCNTKIEQTAW